MGLPAFASFEDLSARIPGGISSSDVARAQAALDDASSEIRAVAGEAWTTTNESDQVVLDLPAEPDWAADAIRRICCAVARRAYENPDGISQESLGSYSASMSNASADIYLTSAEKRTIARIVGGTSGLYTISTTRDDTYTGDLPEFAGDVYIEVEGSELLPFLPIDAGSGL